MVITNNINLRLLMIAALAAYVGTEIGFLAAQKLPVVDDFFYGRHFPIKAGKVDNIIIVAIDNQTMFKSGRLQYKRSVYAQVLSKILEGHPKVIGVDIFFDGVRDIKDDLLFIDMLNAADGNIVLAINKNEPENLLLNIDNVTSMDYFNGNQWISIGNVQGVVDNSTYGGIKTLLLTPRFDQDGRLYDSLPIVVLTKYLNAAFDLSIDNEKSTIGGISIPTFTDKYSNRYMYINYIGGLEAFNPVLFEQIPHMNPEVFKDKIVLIGVTADSMEDSHRTPISDRTPGIVIHANIVHTIINERFIRPMRHSYQSLCVFIAAAAVFMQVYFLKAKISIPAALVSLALVKLTMDFFFISYGTYIHYFPFIVSAAFAGICSVLIRPVSETCRAYLIEI